jgi:apolipoprotein N-acyltransferase
VCAVERGGFYFSIGLGDQWWLAWLAPIPILWLAFGDTKGRSMFAAAWLAFALGGSNILRAYGGTIPVPVVILAIGRLALLFATAVLGARQVYRAFGPVAAMLTFAALWAGLDFVTSFNRSGGSISTPAAAEVGAPALIQSASLVGFVGITVLLGWFSAGIGASLRTRRLLPAALGRTDLVSTKPRLLAVPAWDFGKDDWSHARIAVLRSVEDGVPMARTARESLLTLNDRYGRLIAVTKTGDWLHDAHRRPAARWPGRGDSL